MGHQSCRGMKHIDTPVDRIWPETRLFILTWRIFQRDDAAARATTHQPHGSRGLSAPQHHPHCHSLALSPGQPPATHPLLTAIPSCVACHVLRRSLGSAGSVLRRTAPVGVDVSCSAGHAGRCRSAPIDPVPRMAQQHTDTADNRKAAQAAHRLSRQPRRSLARLGRQSAPTHCSGRRGRLMLRRPCWLDLVDVG